MRSRQSTQSYKKSGHGQSCPAGRCGALPVATGAGAPAVLAPAKWLESSLEMKKPIPHKFYFYEIFATHRKSFNFYPDLWFSNIDLLFTASKKGIVISFFDFRFALDQLKIAMFMYKIVYKIVAILLRRSDEL